MKLAELLQEIDPLYLEDLKSPDHHSMFINEKAYWILIIRGLDVDERGLSYVSRGLVINREKKIYFYDHEEENLKESSLPLERLHELVSPIYARNQKIINNLLKEIDRLEDSLFERKQNRLFMEVWFGLKKDLTRIERHLSRNTGILQEFYKNVFAKNGTESLEFKDIIEQVNLTVFNAQSQMQKLDALYNYYNSIKNEKLNKNIYLLTVLSAIFLPLNLIAGFFGMNTENLFFKENPMGTQYVLSILVGSLILSAFGLPLIRLIDNRIIKYFLGRYNFYSKVSKKIGKIFDFGLD